MPGMRRREFVSLIGGAAAWPLAAGAQQPTMPVIGFLAGGYPEPSANLVAAFRKGLSEMGYVEGRNVAIEYRWALGDFTRFPELAADLIRQRVAVIVTPANGNAARAAKALTTTIPIVFSTGVDAVQIGLVASLNRPGGNATGITSMNVELAVKRLSVMQELLPKATRFAVFVNPNFQLDTMVAELRSAAAATGGQVEVLTVGSHQDYQPAFANLIDKRADALLVSPGTPFSEYRESLVALAARHAVPTIYSGREYALVGGLISYGAIIAEEFRLVGIYTGRILKGQIPAELPVFRAAKFDFVVNLRTARQLGVEVPTSILLRADEVIE
jgi:ABC-type uncharacterized transport system substrate-binding protein